MKLAFFVAILLVFPLPDAAGQTAAVPGQNTAGASSAPDGRAQRAAGAGPQRTQAQSAAEGFSARNGTTEARKQAVLPAQEPKGEVCFTASFKKTDLSDVKSYPLFEQTHHARMAYYQHNNDRLSSEGRLLVGGKYKKDPVFLADLETGKKEEFLPDAYSAKQQSSLTNLLRPTGAYLAVPEGRRLFGFSESGDHAWALLSRGGFKLKNLAGGGEERIFDIKPEGEVLALSYREETGSLTLLETSKETADKIKAFDFFDDRQARMRLPAISFEEAARLEFREEDLIGRRIDLSSGEEERIVIPRGMGELLCHSLSSDGRDLFFVGEDGALYQRPIGGSVWEEPVLERAENGAFRLFGPVKGFHTGRDPMEIKQRCAFLRDGSNILKAPDGTGYILRRIKERQEFFMPYEWFHLTSETKTEKKTYINRFGVSSPWAVLNEDRTNAFFLYYLDEQIKYPFVFSDFHSSRRRSGVYWHIPSGRSHTIPQGGHADYWINRYLHSGRLIFTTLRKPGRGHRNYGALFHPESGKPRLLFEDVPFQNAVYKDGKVFALTTEKELFVIDPSTGDYKRTLSALESNNTTIAGMPFPSPIDLSADGRALSALVYQQEEAKESMKALRIQTVCFPDLPSAPLDIKPADIKSADIKKEDVKAVLLKTAGASSEADGRAQNTAGADPLRASRAQKTAGAGRAQKQAPENLQEETFSSFLSLLSAEETALKIIQDHPYELTAALWNILKNSPRLYIEIFNLYPVLSDLSPGGAFSEEGDSGGQALPAELAEAPLARAEPASTALASAEIQSAAKEVLEILLSDTSRKRRLKGLAFFNPLRPLRPILKALPAPERDSYIEKITLSLVDAAAASRESSADDGEAGLFHKSAVASSVYSSKLYYLINGHVKELFGLKREPYSDAAVYRKGGISRDKTYNITAAILSSDPIEGRDGERSRFGFHYSVVKKISGPLADLKKGGRLIEETAKWKVNGTARKAEIIVDVGLKHGQDIHALVPALRGPDYESLWRDRRLVGLVVFSVNLRDYTRYIADQYLTYLENQGFEFSAHHVVDFKDSIAHYIRSGKADWLMYQGHAGGDERNIFQTDKFSYIIRAVRLREDKEEAFFGKAAWPAHEEIFLVLPRSRKEKDEETEKTAPDFFSVNDLRNAVATRDRNGGGELIYFNTTCWSAEKAVHELGSVASPSFVNIPTFSPSEIFQSGREGALRALIQSLREGRDFAGFREALNANDDYRKNRRNRYIFPDEAVYREDIVGRIQTPLDIDIDLQERRDGQWRRLPAAPIEALN